MDILLYPFGSKRISIWIQKDIHLDPKGYKRISIWIQKDTKGYPFGSKRIQKDILLDPNRYPFVSFCIQKDILLDPKGYPFGSAARICSWMPALHSGSRAFSYACHCHHVFLSLLAKQGLQHRLYRARSGGARPAAAAPGPPQWRCQARSGGAPASIERLDLAGTWKRGRGVREGEE